MLEMVVKTFRDCLNMSCFFFFNGEAKEVVLGVSPSGFWMTLRCHLQGVADIVGVNFRVL